MTKDDSSHKILVDLRDDVDTLKRKLNHPDAKVEELILEIESLKDSLHELTEVFQRSLEEIKGEDLTKSLKEKVEMVALQNETIAKGMVAISEKLEDFMHNMHNGKPLTPSPQVKHSMGMPVISGRVAPSPMGMPVQSQMHTGIPPPPRMEKRSSGLFK